MKKKFKVSYYWRTAGDDIDWETHEVEASNEEEAEEKIMEKLGRVKGFYKVKVEPINNSFERMQELAGLNEEGKPSPIYNNVDEINDDGSLAEAEEALGHAMEILSRVDMEHFDIKNQIHIKNIFQLCTDFVEDYKSIIND
mgnify:CR=1 FL=1